LISVFIFASKLNNEVMANECKVTPKPQSIKELLWSWYLWKPVLSVLGGAVVGFFLYYLQICDRGNCQITGEVWQNVLSGGFIGYFLVNRPCCSC
jgi:hypothetical protein